MARLDLRCEDGFLGLFKRAAHCCHSSLALFLLLTLVSSLYEGAVQEYAFLPSFSISPSNTNSSFDFSFKFKLSSRQNSIPDAGANVGKGQNEIASDSKGAGSLSDQVSAEQTEAAFAEGLDDALSADAHLDDNRSRFAAGGESISQIGEGQGERPVEEDVVSTVADAPIADETEEFLDMLEAEVHPPPENPNLKDDIAETPLPALKLFYVQNSSTDSSIENMWKKEAFVGFPNTRLFARRRRVGDETPNVGVGLLFMLLILTGLLALIFGLIALQHAVVLGSISYSVVGAYMNKRISVRSAVNAGIKSGFKRLIWLSILHGSIRGLQCLIVFRTIFRGSLGMDQMESLILRLLSMPFALLAPFKDKDSVSWDMAFRIGTFLVFDYIFEGIASAIYNVACWVTIMEPESEGGVSAFQRSWKLVKVMELKAITIKLLEAVLCGRSSRWVVQKLVGSFLSAFLISGVQFYFTVVWLVLYISARHKHDGGSRFSHGVLEDFLHRHA